MRRFTETIKGQQVTIEVWEEPDLRPRYNGYASCPMNKCNSKEPFKAMRRSTEGEAKSDAKAAVSKHLSKVHGL